jgi:hypothetical protein
MAWRMLSQRGMRLGGGSLRVLGLLGLLVAGQPACGGSVAATGGGRPDSGGAADGARVAGDADEPEVAPNGGSDATSSLDSAADADTNADAGFEGNADVGLEGSADAGSDTACPSTAAPADVPPTSTVDFVLTNTSNADRYVAVNGMLCNAYDVQGVSWPDTFSCPCECPQPRTFASFNRIGPGMTWPLHWDGRGAVRYTTYVDCSAQGWPGAGCQATQGAAMQPVAPGSYVAEFVVLDALPTLRGGACQGLSDVFQCDMGGAPSGLCDGKNNGVATSVVTQAFTLRASGQTTVQVAVP